MARSAGGLSARKVFLTVSLLDVLACNTLTGLGLSQGIWLLNLPATITLGRLASMLGGDAVGLAITVPAGAAIYGWAGARLYRKGLVRQEAARGAVAGRGLQG